jgi:formamidopyrimidine-DNA glycosylase
MIMPELPEVETVRRLIAPHCIDQRIAGVDLGDFTGVLETDLPFDPITAMIGASILSVQRRGKYLFFPLDTELWLTIHLRMTGRLIVKDAGDVPIRFEHIAIHLGSGEDLRFGDQRKFGRVTLLDKERIDVLSDRLGPEPFDRKLTARVLHERLGRRPGSIKGSLLDQGLIAGLGNIYVDEALWRSRIHPLTASHSLDETSLRRLLRAIQYVLRLSIQNQGTTFSSFENPYGERGNNASYLKVYGRSGERAICDRCGGPLERTVVAGRGTVFCPHCQLLPVATIASRQQFADPRE